MARKPAVMYRSIKQQPYTRKEYMGGIPTSRIIQFVLGNKAGIFPVQLLLCINEKCQIRHTALESARITSNRFLEKSIGVNEYRLKIRVYPHHVLRENPLAAGAGADRFQTGMSHSFGKPIGLAAQVRKGQELMFVETEPKHLEIAKKALKQAIYKFPLKEQMQIVKK